MHIVDIVTFNQTLGSVSDRKLRETHSNIAAIIMTKLLDTLLTKEPVLLLFTVVKFL